MITHIYNICIITYRYYLGHGSRCQSATNPSAPGWIFQVEVVGDLIGNSAMVVPLGADLATPRRVDARQRFEKKHRGTERKRTA